MSDRQLRRFVDQLLRGRRPTAFRPDDAEAQQMRMAIELRAARSGADLPSEEFLTGLHRRLAELADDDAGAKPPKLSSTRRQVIGGVSIAAAAAAVATVVDRSIFENSPAQTTETAQTLSPVDGEWRPVAAVADVPEGAVRAFNFGAVNGFVHRKDGQLAAVSGVCTHQGCKLWFDASAENLRCPCHTTSFAVTGELLNHQLPIAPRPLPRIEVRQNAGMIEVFVPAKPA
ncbi:Rieske (2Fe-2S) protein [Skermania sp. ID1734]|uniref:QcrA and Rieske domain-containing protein n=1 Tax=Skermania sp. ID1734 TaxID=2597516 RepID=UPI0011815CFF|nr:Rieske (2Fe-2S) protein [Skermania sp. ID1734]TSE01496.1 Rieske (2Fe-2S) protein [Skermania sp. ID1734]